MSFIILRSSAFVVSLVLSRSKPKFPDPDALLELMQYIPLGRGSRDMRIALFSNIRQAELPAYLQGLLSRIARDEEEE
jgi:hypothetical protein